MTWLTALGMSALGLGTFMTSAWATPANRAALVNHYDHFLTKRLAQCTTCHLPTEKKLPETLEEIPHNAFGRRLRVLREELRASGKSNSLPERLVLAAEEDSDGDGTANHLELLLGTNPGQEEERPSAQDLGRASARAKEFQDFLASYRWRPFEPVKRPSIPVIRDVDSSNPIDAFLAEERVARGLHPRPEASREILMRRAYMDLLGLNPSVEEQRAFLADESPRAWEELVDKLLADPRHGERWGRHWMDVWRYSDWAGWTDGKQIRDSQPHIWRWRDWIVESLNADKPYDRMLSEMLAADEIAPEDPAALRATGFLARNYKMLSREQWLEDTIKHTSQAFMGVTMGCAKCHDHMFDPISQRDYYAMRAIFEPHQVRLDKIPGQLDTTVDGLARVYDSEITPTWFFQRGDERQPLKDKAIEPAVPAVFGGKLAVKPLTLPKAATHPDQRDFVVRESIAASETAKSKAAKDLEKLRQDKSTKPEALREAELSLAVAEKKHDALLGVIQAEQNPGQGPNAKLRQRVLALAEAELKLQRTQSLPDADKTKASKLKEASKELATAINSLLQPLDANYQARSTAFPATSSGRRRAFAEWLIQPNHPLTARVAINHIWLRHFGRTLVPNVADFGRNGRPATHPKLVDWLAAEFMSPTQSGSSSWSMRHIHRLILTSAAYRMASTPDETNSAKDPDNIYLWRMNSRRLEAEAVRDSLLCASGSLDLQRGGPEIDQALALTSSRRSIYLRNAAEKQAEILQIFDGPAITECYQRRPSVVPQQALALGNSELALRETKKMAEILQAKNLSLVDYVEEAYRRILARQPRAEETKDCLDFLQAGRDRHRDLLLVLVNHNDFVTLR